ncbi:hypothetical protein [Streptomyces sp. NPDC005799]|uniref:hypothetical protein n=1 Tax=Streptomyces sp. NPDC005799 TaxID=3154678 RepID=UPI0033D9B8A3
MSARRGAIASIEIASQGLDGVQPLAEAHSRLFVGAQFAVRQIPHPQIGDPAEGGPPDLGSDLALSGVGRDRIHAVRGVGVAARRQVEHAHVAGVDRGRVLHLERRSHFPLGLQPQDVDEADRLGGRSSASAAGSLIRQSSASRAP